MTTRKSAGRTDPENTEELEKIPPKIIHVFTKVDVITPENMKFRQINDEIITVLTRDGYIDQKIYTSCKEQEIPDEKPHMDEENDEEQQAEARNDAADL